MYTRFKKSKILSTPERRNNTGVSEKRKEKTSRKTEKVSEEILKKKIER
ncbi:hypothetical protein [Mucilaginibacter sp.]